MIIEHNRFPGYNSYTPTRQKTHELLSTIDDFIDSSARFLSLSFDTDEEAMHAISILFSVAQEYADIYLNVKSNTLYLEKSTPVDFDEVEMLRAIFKEYK